MGPPTLRYQGNVDGPFRQQIGDGGHWMGPPTLRYQGLDGATHSPVPRDWMGPPTLRYQGNVDGPFRQQIGDGGDWMGPPTLRYQGIGWGHPLSGTKEMWMAPFVFFIGRQSAEVNVLGTVKVGDAIGQFKGTSAENDQVPCGVK